MQYLSSNYRRLIMVVSMISMELLSIPSHCHIVHKDGMRDSRYCEVILSQKRLNISVYSTVGLNDCPATIWKNIKKDVIKHETGSFFVHLNGPHYWVLDSIEQEHLSMSSNKNIGGLLMREVGVLHLTLLDIVHGAAPYHEHSVERETTFVYSAGRPIYEIITLKGQVFVMQSYRLKKSTKAEPMLSALGSRLSLPKGWTFRTGVLTHDAHVKTVNNKALVMQDNLFNTYQLASSDFLNDK